MAASRLVPTEEQNAVLDDRSVGAAEAARRTGISNGTVFKIRNERGYVKGSTALVVKTAVATPAAVEAEVSREDLLDAEVRELRQALRKGRKSTVHEERVLLSIERAIEAIPPPNHPAPAPCPEVITKARHRHVLILSDWHCGEIVDPEQMGGLNAFNLAILQSRVNDVVEGALKYKSMSPPMTGLDVWALGDMASGMIHKLEETNEIPAAEQYVRVGHMLGSAIEKLAAHYPEVWCGGVYGNHPRAQSEPASKDGYNSGDWIAYHVARAYTAHLANITWEIPRAGMLVRHVAGQNWLLLHGDGIKSTMPGVPAGGVTRRTNELRKTYARAGIVLDGFAMGHFHNENIWQGSIIVNGSLVGSNEFGQKFFGGGANPCQFLITLDEKRKRLSTVSYITPTAGLPVNGG